MSIRTRPRLDLDPATVRQARTLARKAGQPIVRLAERHTTVSVERATLRLAGPAGADPDGTPWVNRLLDAVRADVGLEHGVALPVWDALHRQEAADLGVSLEQLSQSILHNHARVRGTAGPIAGDPSFQEAKAATFRENEELYRRLAK